MAVNMTVDSEKLGSSEDHEYSSTLTVPEIGIVPELYNL